MNNKITDERNTIDFLLYMQDIKEKLNKIKENVNEIESKFDWAIEFINRLKSNVDDYANILREERYEHFPIPLEEKPSNEIIEKLEHINEKINSLEELGITLTSQDFLYLGYCFYQRDFYENALNEFNNALDSDSFLFEAYYFKSASFLKLKRYDEALETVDSALKIFTDNTALILKKINIFFDQGKYEEIIPLYDEILVRDPNNSKILFRKADILSKLGKNEEAIEFFHRAQNEDPGNREILFQKVNFLRSLNLYEEAIHAFDIALQINKNDAELWLKKATLLSHCGRDEDSLVSCQKVLEIEPDNTKALYKTSDSLVKLGRYEEALEYFDKALYLKPDDPRAWAYRGRLYANLGQYEEAIRSIEKSLEIKPEYFEALFNKSYIFFEIGEYEKALDTINKLLDIKPDSLRILDLKYKIHFKLKNYQELITVLDQILEINSNDAEIWLLKANTLVNLNENEEALKSFEMSLSIDPFNCNTWISKAFTLSKLNRLDEALKAYDKTLELNPYDSKIWDNRGFALSKLERYEDALNSYNQALKLDPNRARTWDNKGFTLSKLGKYEDALKNYDKALELDPHNSKIWNNKGFALSKLGKYEDALNSYDQSLEIDPNKARIWDSMGFTLSKLERYDDALNSYNKALEIDPNSFKTLISKGFALSKLERYEESIDTYNRALKVKPDDLGILSKISYAFSRSGKNEEALNVLEKILQIDPDNDNIWYEKGIIFSKMGERDKALQAFAITLEKKNRNKTTFDEEQYSYTEMELRNEILENNGFETDELEDDESEDSELDDKELEDNELEDGKAETNELEDNRLKEKEIELNGSGYSINESYWYDKGIELLDSKKYSEAIEAFDETLKINPFLSKMWFAKSDAICKLLLEMSKYKNDLQILISKDGAFTNECASDYKLDKYEEALMALNSGFQLEFIEKKKIYEPITTKLNKYETSIQDVKTELLDSNGDFRYSFSNNRYLPSEPDIYKIHPRKLCTHPKFFELINDSKNISSQENPLQNKEVGTLEENPPSDPDKQERNGTDDVENTTICTSETEKFYEKNISDSFLRPVRENSDHLTRLLDPSTSAINTTPSYSNFFSISKDIISGNYGLLFKEFYDQNLDEVPIVEALAKADDELLLYKYYTNDNLFVPNLKLVNCSYRPEYEKLENWFCNYFFKVLRERVSTEGKEIEKNYYEELEREFIKFRYSIDDTVQSLGLKKNREKYLGFDNTNFMLLFFKKVIRSRDISPDCIDIAGKVFIPGSAMFFLELYSLLIDVKILDAFQKTIEGMNYEDKVKLVHSPRVLLIPWSHQKRAFESWESNNRNGIIEMATATGKTLVGLMAIEALSKIKDNAIVRIFAHSTAILNQWRREVIEKLGLLSNIQGDYTKSVYCNGISVYFNTLQSVYKNPEFYSTDLLIVDEVHHLAAQQYGKALEVKCEWKIGLSATIEGERLNILENKLGPVVYNFSLKEALENGVLPKFEWKIHTVYLSIDEKTEFDNISKKIIELFNYVRFDYQFIQEASDGKLETIENLYDFVQIVEKARYRGKNLPENWKQLQLSIIQRRWIIHRSRPKIEDAILLAKKYLSLKFKVIIFAMDIPTCESISQELEKSSENIFMVHSRLKKDVNENILKFKNAQYGALIGARMLDEGIDIPDAEIGINVSSSKTRLQLIQRMGRVLRMKQGKKPVFHHYIAIPEQSSYVNVDDNLVMIDDLSWIQDTALKMGVNAELINEEQPLEKLRLEAEKMVRDDYSRTKKTNLPSYGTLKVENILGTFPDSAIQSIIGKLSELSSEHQISDVEWSDIVRKAHGKKEDEPLTISGYWWVLLLGDRNPMKVKEIFHKYQSTISSETYTN